LQNKSQESDINKMD